MKISLSNLSDDSNVPLIGENSNTTTSWSVRLIHLINSLLFTFFYLCFTYLLIGLRTEHVISALSWLFFYNLSSNTRKFTIGLSAFVIYWIIYDYLKAFPNYKYRSVSIEEIYQADKFLFGLNYHGIRITHNEFWKLHENIILTLASGFFYLTWIPLPLSFAIYLYFKKRDVYFYFSLNFLLNNLIGFLIYYLYPAAPPWYLEEVGLCFNSSTVPSSARLRLFDKYLNISIFSFIYSKNSNIFASMPSLHVSYPSLVLLYSIKHRFSLFINCLFILILSGICFAAIYTSHHYILDIIAGIINSMISFLLIQFLIYKSSTFNEFVKILIKETRFS